MPKISVLMPVYNCDAFVKPAVESVLQQTVADFELIVIDDASTDNTVGVVQQINDSRIQLFQKPSNTGYTDSLNMGLSLAKGEFIARMDGDDLSMPNRFALQLESFEKDPLLVLCGSSMAVIDSDQVVQLPVTHDDIKVTLLSYCCMAHPSVMMRASFLRKENLSYDPSKEPAEDYNLWVRMVRKGKLENRPECLIAYRLHTNQTSQKRVARQQSSSRETKIDHLSAITSRDTASKFYSIPEVIAAESIKRELDFLGWLKNTIGELEEANNTIRYFHPAKLHSFFMQHYRENAQLVFLQSKRYGLAKLPGLISHQMKGFFSMAAFMKNIMKCLVFHRVK